MVISVLGDKNISVAKRYESSTVGVVIHDDQLGQQAPEPQVRKPSPGPDHLPQPTQVGLKLLPAAPVPLVQYQLHDAGDGLVRHRARGAEVCLEHADSVALPRHRGSVIDYAGTGVVEKTCGGVNGYLGEHWVVQAEWYVMLCVQVGSRVRLTVKGCFEAGDEVDNFLVVAKALSLSALPSKAGENEACG